MKKRIKVKFEGCPFVEQNCLPILQKHYEVLISDYPDFVFFDYTNYKNCTKYDCVRIVYIGENNRPDFNLFDYAIGFDKIDFDNRHLQMPLYAMPTNREHILLPALHKHEKALGERERFCCFIVSNGDNSNPIREKMFHKICEYQKVDSAGRFLNNMPDGENIDIDHTQEFIGKYKFQICFENSSYKSYTTEKLIGAFAAGTIPIYWGDPAVGEVFNTDSFIWLRDTSEEEINRVYKQVEFLDQNAEAYEKMMKTPILRNPESRPAYFEEDCLERFLVSIFDQSPQAALKRTNAKDGWGKLYEDAFEKQQLLEKTRIIQLIYRVIHKLEESK